MNEERDHLRKREERLRVWTVWLGRTLEDTVNTARWRGDPYVFFFDTNDGEGYAIERNDPSLRVELVRGVAG